MNAKTAKLLGKVARGATRGARKRTKRQWYATPWKERAGLRRALKRALAKREES